MECSFDTTDQRTAIGRQQSHREPRMVRRRGYAGKTSAGVGRRLLAHLASLAVARGCGRLEWQVLDWNEPAIGFYRKLGARPLDEWTVYRLTGDALTALAGSVDT